MVLKSHMMDVPLFERWLKEKKQLADSSIYTYTKSIVRFLSKNPDLENLEDYNNFLIAVAIKKRCNHYYSALRAFIEFKIDDAATRNRLINDMIVPKERQDVVIKRRHLSEDQILDIINYLDNQKHRVMALIQTITGIRAGDILRLRMGGIIPEEYNGKPVLKLNIIGKGSKMNVAYIHDEVIQDIIMNYVTNNVNHENYYFIELSQFTGRQDNIYNENLLIKMNYQWFWADLKQALTTAGIDRKDFATHDFKRCFARRVWEKYKDIHVLQGLLNHADPKVTMRYLSQSGLQNIDYHYDMQTK